MFEKVLVPTDFSKYAYRTVECVTDMPSVKETVVLYVVDATSKRHGWNYDKETDDARIRLNEEQKYLQSLGKNVKVRLEVILEGNVEKAIQKVADEEKVFLVAMPSRGNSLIRGVLLGGVSSDVLRHGTTNLLIMRHGAIDQGGDTPDKLPGGLCQNIFNRVLYATDLSPLSAACLSQVRELPGLKEVDLVNVVSSGESPEEIDHKVMDAARQLNGYGDRLSRDGFKVRVHVPVGSPAEEICLLADRENVTLIVITSIQGKGWLKQALGSTAYDVGRTARKPVLVIRAGEHA
jgi:nucleotide-binding universal stress UspA family protein